MASPQDARKILKGLGMPAPRSNRMAGLTLLALCRLTPDAPWAEARRGACTVTKGIMDHLREHYGVSYAPNTRETVRKEVLHHFILEHIADHNPFRPKLPTNSPRSHYAVTRPALAAIRQYGTPGWHHAARLFQSKREQLAARRERARRRRMVAVRMPDGADISLSPGRHNQLQKDIIEKFAPRFAPGARLLYLGDTARKRLVFDGHRLAKLGIPLAAHGKLPDIVLHDGKRRRLLLIEAVTSHGPMSRKRVAELERIVSAASLRRIYVSAFTDHRAYRRHARHIAWGTEVWTSESPEHMIHYNGDRFMGGRP